MNAFIFIVACAGLIILMLYGNKTYHISTESFKEQLSVISENDLDKVYDFRLGIIPGLIGGKQFYNGIKSIICLDKQDRKFDCTITKNAQIRITKKDNKRQLFYLDTVFIKNNYVYGNKTHFLKAPIDPISLDNIEKIELQFRFAPKKEVN